jgi:predicted dehydrogenase
MIRYKAAVFGTGFVGRVHLEAIRRLGYVQVYAIGESEKEKARRLGDEFHVEKTHSDWRVLLEDPEIDVVHVCTPNVHHYPMAKASLEAGKHVICEKPLATSAAQAQELIDLATQKNLAHATFHNLRFYPMVQHIRRMREAGDLGDILVVQGTYSQDWLLYDTDWNWRIDSKANGPSRCMADIGSHWCDMAEHLTGLRVKELCADLQTFHATRKKPKRSIETFAGKNLQPEDYDEIPIDTEDFGAVLFRMGDGRTRGSFTASQVNAGRKNSLRMEIYGSKAGVIWDQERPDELWIGNRNEPNRVIVKDPSLMLPAAKSYADLPGGHSEGYDDTFKQLMRRFYRTVEDRKAPVEYPTFVDGLRQLMVLEKVLESSRNRAWVEVPQLTQAAGA